MLNVLMSFIHQRSTFLIGINIIQWNRSVFLLKVFFSAKYCFYN